MTKTKFGNQIRDIADDIAFVRLKSVEWRQWTIADLEVMMSALMRLRDVAAAIDQDHAETLQMVQDIQETLK